MDRLKVRFAVWIEEDEIKLSLFHTNRTANDQFEVKWKVIHWKLVLTAAFIGRTEKCGR